MSADPKIDELLNSFIDGELPPRQQTEVQRLIMNDPQLARRLQELRNCKTLFSSLPRAEAPRGMVEQVIATLERRTLLDQKAFSHDVRKGARHLFFRKLVTAAAMIGLVAILSVVVYTVVAPPPRTGPSIPMASDLPPGREVVEPRPSEVHVTGFDGALKLQTRDLIAVDAYFNRAIAENGLSRHVTEEHYGKVRTYSFSCGREGVKSLLAELGDIWQRFDSATLAVEEQAYGAPAAVSAVTVEQVTEIVENDSLDERMRLAKNFALLNSMADLMPGKHIFAAIDKSAATPLVIPKPALTGGTGEGTVPLEKDVQVNLTIVLVGR
jgi:hypothetical protein